MREARHPHDRIQQRNARQHRKEEADDARAFLPPRRQPADQERDENDVVDAENDLERREDNEREPSLRIGEKPQHGVFLGVRLRQVVGCGLLQRREYVLGGKAAIQRNGT